MTEEEWKTAPIADLLLHTLEIHRARYGAEPDDSAYLRPPTAVLRCDLGRKHMLLAFAVARLYWNRLAPTARWTIAEYEAVEEGEQEQDPSGDDYVEFTNTLITCHNATEGETALALWLVFGWWHGVKTELAGQELPTSWRPLFDDIFGDAFKSVVFDLAWLTDPVVALATGIYAERAFDRMPILADALEEAGCDHADILAHCRGDGPHARGCWVVDLVLGKS